jgi:hypothetical protein
MLKPQRRSWLSYEICIEFRPEVAIYGGRMKRVTYEYDRNFREGRKIGENSDV